MFQRTLCVAEGLAEDLAEGGELAGRDGAGASAVEDTGMNTRMSGVPRLQGRACKPEGLAQRLVLVLVGVCVDDPRCNVQERLQRDLLLCPH